MPTEVYRQLLALSDETDMSPEQYAKYALLVALKETTVDQVRMSKKEHGRGLGAKTAKTVKAIGAFG